MKFTIGWLKDHLETEASLELIVEALNKIGLEVSYIKKFHKDLNKLKIVKIIKIEQHHNADKLKICHVDDGNNIFKVVCGAPNVRQDMKAVYAPEGTYIPGVDIVIKKVEIRGVESNGMLCSEKELEISEDHEGIIELPSSSEVGINPSKLIAVDDPIIEIEITPNRGDCLGVRGIARDLSSFGLGSLKNLNIEEGEGEFDSTVKWKIDLPEEKKYLCPKIYGRTFKNIKNCVSPIWLKNRLTSVGLRPISALVDITNYIMIDIGRPLHAYDVKKITGNNLTVRLAKNGEKLKALNGKLYDLEEDMLIISDDDGPDDLAGIMGGERTGIDDNTTEMFLEAAIFNPSEVSKTGRMLNINTDARYRFERGLDYDSPEFGIKYASFLVKKLCGGQFSKVNFISKKNDIKKINFNKNLINKMIGIQIDDNKVTEILEKLGFSLKKIDKINWEIERPSWRNDIDGEMDIVEEVIRIYGYENIPINFLERKNYITKPSLNDRQRKHLYSRKFLTARGYSEVVTFSFLNHKNAKLFGGGSQHLKLVNPISSELSDMRPTIIPNLIEASQKNRNKGINNISIFEIGPIFKGDLPENQLSVVTGLRFGNKIEKNWKNEKLSFDFYDIKSDVFQCLEALSCPTSGLKIYDSAPKYYHPGKSGVLKLGNTVIASMGEINPIILNHFNTKEIYFCFEIFLDNLPRPKKVSSFKPLLKSSPLQSVKRDFAFILDNNVLVEDLISVVKSSNRDHIIKVMIFDIYTGENIPKDKKSIALSVEMQPTQNTFTDQQLEDISNTIINSVSKKLNAEIRKA